jgi:ribonuclease VapC
VGPVTFVDTSAIVAILSGDPDADELADALESSSHRYVSPAVRLECCMVLARRRDVLPSQAEALFDEFSAQSSLVEAPIDARTGRLAVVCHEAYGRGRHPAKLNFGDCLSYACARALGVPLLYKGDDFAQTDVNGD